LVSSKIKIQEQDIILNYRYTTSQISDQEILKIGDHISVISQKDPQLNRLTISIRFLTGKLLPVSVTRSCTISWIKEYLQNLESIPVYEQTLIFAGKVLLDENTVGDYRIDEESTIYLVLKISETDPNRPLKTPYYSEIEYDGNTTYEVTYKKNGKPSEFTLSTDTACTTEHIKYILNVELDPNYLYRIPTADIIRMFNVPLISKNLSKEAMLRIVEILMKNMKNIKIKKVRENECREEDESEENEIDSEESDKEDFSFSRKRESERENTLPLKKRK